MSGDIKFYGTSRWGNYSSGDIIQGGTLEYKKFLTGDTIHEMSCFDSQTWDLMISWSSN